MQIFEERYMTTITMASSSHQPVSSFFPKETLEKVPRFRTYDRSLYIPQQQKKPERITPNRRRNKIDRWGTIPDPLRVYHTHRLQLDEQYKVFWKLKPWNILKENPLFWRYGKWRPTVELFIWLTYHWSGIEDLDFPFLSTNPLVALPLSLERHFEKNQTHYMDMLSFWEIVFHNLNPDVYAIGEKTWIEDSSLLSPWKLPKTDVQKNRHIIIQKELGGGNFGKIFDVDLEVDGKVVQRNVAVKIVTDNSTIAETAFEYFILYMLSQLVHTGSTSMFPTFFGDMIFRKPGVINNQIIQTCFMSETDISVFRYFQNKRKEIEEQEDPQTLSVPWLEYALEHLYILCSVVQGCALAEKYFAFGHGDLHSSNIMVSIIDPENKDIPVPAKSEIYFKNEELEAYYEDPKNSFLKKPLTFLKMGIQPKIVDFGFSTFRISSEWLLRQMLSPSFQEEDDEILPWNFPFDPTSFVPQTMSYQPFEDIPSNLLILLSPLKTMMSDYFYDILNSKLDSQFQHILPTYDQVSICFEPDSPSKERMYQEKFPGYPMTIPEELEFMKTYPQEEQPLFYVPYHFEVLAINTKQSAMGFFKALRDGYGKYHQHLLDNFLIRILGKQFFPLLKVNREHLQYAVCGLFPFFSFSSIYNSFDYIFHSYRYWTELEVKKHQAKIRP